MKTLLLALCALTVVASAEPCQKERTLVGKNALVRDGSGRIAGTASTSGNSTTNYLSLSPRAWARARTAKAEAKAEEKATPR